MSNVTRVLSQIEAGAPSAAEQLLPMVYEELGKLAAARLVQEKPGQALQTTALVHDADLRLVDTDKAPHWNSRGQAIMNEREIFEKAIEIQDPAQLHAFLDQACGGDAALRARLDELLASHPQASPFLNVPVVDPFSPPAQDRVQPTIELAPPSGATVGGETLAPHSDDEDDESHPVTDLSFLQPPTKPGSIGTLGHYVILQVLGQGAFGIVFKAFDEKLHRHVAIKAMNPQLAATSPPRKRFVREARSVAALKHENIVQVYSVEEQPLPYMVMEYIDGPTLQQKLDGAGPLEVPEILRLGRQMAAGLAAAHEKGLIHRDIKPGNILLEAGAEQKVKITDFGLARAADDATMTRTGAIAGTPMYMAPEQALGQTLDHRADLFSLGSVLYQMVCGRAPFRGPHAMAVLKRVIDEAPRPIQDILPGAPDWLCTIVGKLHAKNPDERFQTAKELADLLANCQNELQVNGKVTCVVAPPQAAPASSHQPASVAVTPAVDRQSAAAGSRQPLVVAAAAVLLLVAGLTVTELTGITSFLRKRASDHQPVASGDTKHEKQVSTVQNTSPPGWHGWPMDAPKPAIAPFDAEQAKQHQEAWAEYLNVPVEYTNSLGMKFRLIPPGEFIMGCGTEEIEAALKEISVDDKHWQECIKSEGPQHEVILTQPIYLGVNEVTQGEYEKVMGTNPSHFAPTGMGNAAVAGMETTDHPVETVSWSDAAEFSAKLSTQEKLKPFYFQAGETITPLEGTGYRLPSEAEWEFACRAGTASKYWIGDQKEDLQQAGWNAVNSGDRTHAAGELKTNPFGLCDIHGNVWEWVQDGWEPNKYDGITELPAVNPGFPFTAGSHQVMRGGNWYNSASLCRSSVRNRNAGDRTYCEDNLGFRVALSVDAVRQALKVTGPAMPQPFEGGDAYDFRFAFRWAKT